MEIKILYRYTREDGGITTSPIKPNSEYTESYRLIANENKLITNDNINFYSSIDVQSVDGWYEVDKPAETNEEEHV